METSVRTPVKIAVLGMDERSVARMATLFKIVYKGRCEFAQGEDASLGIVDLDSESNVWDKFQRQYPTLPAIVMSESPASIEGAVYVAKPAKLDLLWDAIFNLVTGLPPADEIARKSDSAEDSSPPPAAPGPGQSGTSTAASAMDARFESTGAGLKSVKRSDLQDEAARFYAPDDFLLGRLLSTLKENAGRQCSIHVQCGKGSRLILIPDQGRAYTNLTDSQLRNLSVVTLKGKFTIEITIVPETAEGGLSANDSAGLESMSIDHLVWDLALRTARGRVPEGTDLSAPLYLQRWPNFPRLPRTPHGMRIASLWVDNPRTLDDIAVNLDIERTDVYSFYSAAAATGLAGRARRRVDGLIAPRDVAEKETYKRGLLASILRHLGK